MRGRVLVLEDVGDGEHLDILHQRCHDVLTHDIFAEGNHHVDVITGDDQPAGRDQRIHRYGDRPIAGGYGLGERLVRHIRGQPHRDDLFAGGERIQRDLAAYVVDKIKKMQKNGEW